VIIKDLSRLGRNYLESGTYIRLQDDSAINNRGVPSVRRLGNINRNSKPFYRKDRGIKSRDGGIF
jgi:hypothetical protein